MHNTIQNISLFETNSDSFQHWVRVFVNMNVSFVICVIVWTQFIMETFRIYRESGVTHGGGHWPLSALSLSHLQLRWMEFLRHSCEGWADVCHPQCENATLLPPIFISVDIFCFVIFYILIISLNWRMLVVFPIGVHWSAVQSAGAGLSSQICTIWNLVL